MLMMMIHNDLDGDGESLSSRLKRLKSECSVNTWSLMMMMMMMMLMMMMMMMMMTIFTMNDL